MARTSYDQALDLLAARAYSVADLRRKLARRQLPQGEIDTVVGRLIENGLLDDTKYAHQYARQKLLNDSAARHRIRMELRRKGIAAEMADGAVDAVIEDEGIDTSAAVERVARKKLLSLGDLDDQVRRRRLYGFLARRGYSIDEIKSVVDRLIREER
jgi:regulatory protein